MVAWTRRNPSSGKPRPKERGVLTQPGSQIITLLNQGEGLQGPGRIGGGSELENR